MKPPAGLVDLHKERRRCNVAFALHNFLQLSLQILFALLGKAIVCFSWLSLSLLLHLLHHDVDSEPVNLGSFGLLSWLWLY